MENANKICLQYGYQRCPECPLYETCTKTYDTTEAFESAIENAAIEYLKSTNGYEEKEEHS